MDGYIRDYAILLLVTLLVGGSIALGVAITVDTFFGDTVRKLIGNAGDYDVLIQVRQERGQVAEEDLIRVVSANFPGARLIKGVSLVGKLHFFLKLPPDFQNTEAFESIHPILQQVPGYTGLTFMIEPSLVIGGVHPYVKETLVEYAEALRGVRFTVTNQNSLIVVLDSPVVLTEVTHSLEGFFKQNKMAEVRLPIGVSVHNLYDAFGMVNRAVSSVLGENGFQKVDITNEEDAEDYYQTLNEMKILLLSLATKVWVPTSADMIGSSVVLTSGMAELDTPVMVRLEEEAPEGDGVLGYVIDGEIRDNISSWQSYSLLPSGQVGDYLGSAHIYSDRQGLFKGIEECVRLLGDLEEFAQQTQSSVQEAQKLLDGLNRGLDKVESLSQSIMLLKEGLAALGGDSPGNPQQVLLAVLLGRIINNPVNAEENSPLSQIEESLAQIDLSTFQENLKALADRVGQMDEINADVVINQIEQVKNTLPALDDQKISEAVKLIDDSLSSRGIAGDRITFLTPGDIPIGKVESAIEDALGLPGVELLLTESGAVNPSARGTLMQVLGEVRHVVAGICSVITVLLTLLLDHSVLFAWAEETTADSVSPGWDRPYIFAAATGGILMAGIVFLSGGNLPFLGFWGMTLLGIVLGVITCALAKRISPVDSQEIEAGIALGLSPAQVVREIVIPRGRPGLLTTFNRWRQVFR
jgi:ABC-type arginine transport system permease subunit